MTKLKEYIRGWSWSDYGTASLLLIFCAFNKLMPVLMILTFLSLIKIRKSKEISFKLLSFKYPFVWMILFYLAHLLGLFYTENFDFGVLDIGMKLSFILFPLFFILTKLTLTFRKLSDLFLIGLLIAVFISFGYAIFRSFYNLEDNQWAYFTASYFSYMMHRSYFGTYLALGTLIAFFHFFKYGLTKEKKSFTYLFVTLILFTSTLLTFSKAAILILIIQIIPLTYYLLHKYTRKIYALIGVLSLGVFLTIIFTTTNGVSARFSKMIGSLTEEQTIAKSDIESNSSRLIMWFTSWELITEKPITGVGTGDVKDALIERNYKLGNIGVAEMKLNSHNQFLNTTVQIGFLGLIPLLAFFLTSIRIAFKSKSIILFMMLSTFFSTMLFESFMETQAGIIPVTFLILLFTLNKIEKLDFQNNKNQILKEIIE